MVGSGVPPGEFTGHYGTLPNSDLAQMAAQGNTVAATTLYNRDVRMDMQHGGAALRPPGGDGGGIVVVLLVMPFLMFFASILVITSIVAGAAPTLRSLLESSPLADSVSQTARGMDGDPATVALAALAVVVGVWAALSIARWAYRRYWVRSRLPRIALIGGITALTIVRSAALLIGVATVWVSSNIAHGLDLDPEWANGIQPPSGWWPYTLVALTVLMLSVLPVRWSLKGAERDLASLMGY